LAALCVRACVRGHVKERIPPRSSAKCAQRPKTHSKFEHTALIQQNNPALCEVRAEAKEAVEPRGYEIAQADGSTSMDDSNNWFARGIGDDR